MDAQEIRAYLIGKGLTLKNATGAEVHTHCVFCGEEQNKRGRLYINCDEGGAYLCHICGEKGNIHSLRKFYGDAEDNAPTLEIETKYAIMDAACRRYSEILQDRDDVFSHLEEKRALHTETIIKTRLGFAEGDLYGYLRGEGFKEEDILASGLVEERGEEYVDALAGMITIPYIVAGNVVQIRGRAHDNPDGPKYKTPKGAQARLFNTDTIWDSSRQLIVAEGEFDCYSGDTEVLTPKGWVRFDRYSGEPVAQWSAGGAIEFVFPEAWAAKDVGRTIGIRSGQNGGVDFSVTPRHRMVVTQPDGSSPHIIEAEETNARHLHIPRVGYLDGPGLDLSDDEIRLLIAIQADGTIDVRQHGGFQYVRFGFSKERKQQRLRALLERLTIECSDNTLADGNQSICFRVPVYLWAFKKFPYEWIVNASRAQRELIIDELAEWDGNRPKEHLTEWATSLEHNAEWIQALAHTTGRCATLMHRSNNFGSWRKVHILHNKTSTSRQALHWSEQGPQRVYCVQVPSTMLLVRRNEQVAVSGNCMLIEQMDPSLHAVGVPGAQSWQEKWDGYVNGQKRLLTVFDRDRAGEMAFEKFKERFGPKVRQIQLSERGTKLDPTDWILQGGTAEAFHQAINKAITGGLLKSIRDVGREHDELEAKGGGLKFGIDKLDETLKKGLVPGAVHGMLAHTNAGKTVFSCNLIHRMSMVEEQQDMKILYVTLEQPGRDVHPILHRIHRFYNLDDDREGFEAFWDDRLMIVDENTAFGPRAFETAIDAFDYSVGSLPDLTVVDYLGYYSNYFEGKSDYERTSAAIFHLNDLAKDSDLTIWTPSQISKAKDRGIEPGLNDARDSGKVGETFNTVFSWFSEDHNEHIEAGERTGVHHLTARKSRQGGLAQRVSFQFAPLSLVYAPMDDWPLVNMAKQEMIMETDYHDDWETALTRHKSKSYGKPMDGEVRALIEYGDGEEPF